MRAHPLKILYLEQALVVPDTAPNALVTVNVSRLHGFLCHHSLNPHNQSKMKINISNIPIGLKETERWVCWEEQMRDGKATKIPKSPVDGVDFASTSDPDTWSSFSDAVKTFRNQEYDGVGFVFTTEGEYVGVDLDDCRDPDTGEFQDWAIDVMETLDSFSEISPSGTGSHVIVKGSMPEGRKRRGHIEMYEDGRYFTVTGEVVSKHGGLIDEPRGITERSDELREVASKYLYDGDEGESESPDIDVSIDDIETDPTEVSAKHTGSGELSGLPEQDQDRLKQMFRRKRQSYELWHGSTAGYPSQSEADQALCNHLAYWLDKSAPRIDSAFRRSRLIRDKWDEDRGKNTYGELTIKEAIKSTGSTYTSEQEQSDKTENQVEADKDTKVDGNQTERNQSDNRSSGDQKDAIDNQAEQLNSDRSLDRDQSRSRSRSRDRRGNSDTTEQPGSEKTKSKTDDNTQDGNRDVEGAEAGDRRRGRKRVDSLVPESGQNSNTKSSSEPGPDQEMNGGNDDESTSKSPDYDIPDPDDLGDLGWGGGFGESDNSGSNTKHEGDENESSKSIFDPDSLSSQPQNQRERQRGDSDGHNQSGQSGQDRNGSGSQSASQQRQSTNGKRKIPTKTEERAREFSFKLDELEEKIGHIEVEYKNEHEVTQQNIQDIIDELRLYEDVVDELDGQVKVLSMLVGSLCDQIGTPNARELASIARNLPDDPSEIPTSVLNQPSDQPTQSVQSNPPRVHSDQLNPEAEDPEEAGGGFFDALKNIGSRQR